MSGVRRLRIVGGRWKRTPIDVVDAPALRPTPDRVRETLFNWLGANLDRRYCLDVFAGSGALGLEAASRGAAGVTWIELDPRAAAAIARLLDRLRERGEPVAGCELLRGEAPAALASLARAGRRFDLVFLDPPFGQDWIARILPAVAPVLAPVARLYIESEMALSASAVANALRLSDTRCVTLARSDRAGQVHYHLFDIGPGDGQGDS